MHSSATIYADIQNATQRGRLTVIENRVSIKAGCNNNEATILQCNMRNLRYYQTEQVNYLVLDVFYSLAMSFFVKTV